MTSDEIGGTISPCVSGGKSPDRYCPSGYVHSPIAPGVQESVVNRYANEHMEHLQALCESEGVRGRSGDSGRSRGKSSACFLSESRSEGHIGEPLGSL